MFSSARKIKSPSRPKCGILIDEDGSSINDSLFLVDMAEQNTIPDLPSTRHGGVYELNFADGHVESDKWLASSSGWVDGPPGPGLGKIEE